MEKQPLASLPVPSTSFTSDPTLMHPGGDVELRYEFEREGAAACGGIRFAKVRAYRFRAEGHCTAWHVQGAYDTLVEVTSSDWITELLDAEPSDTWGHWELHHYLLFLDSAGAYEVAAGSWYLLPDEPAP